MKELTHSSDSAIKWFDDFEMSNERTVFTYHELHIPGLRLFAELHPDKSVAPLVPHYHEDAFEFSFVTRGSITFFENSEEVPETGGNIHISFPNKIHSTNELPLASVHMYWIQLEVNNPSDFLYFNEETAAKIITRLNSLHTHTIETDNRLIKKVIKNAFSLCLASADPLLIASYISLFVQLLLHFADQQRNVPITPVDIQLTIKYIRDHIEEPIDMATLAILSNLSVSQFKQKFSHYIGIPPRQFINREKIKTAKQMLKSGMTVTETAMALGFNNSSYFSSVFKKYQNCSPKEFITSKRQRLEQ